MKLHRLLPVVLLLLTQLMAGCAVTKTDIQGFNLISIAEEKELGDKFAVEIEKQNPVVNDPELQGYVERVGKRLLTGARSVDFPYTFKVVLDDSVNAFAIPGGHTYVNTGLIKMADTEAELAAVMAHEINHVVARHGTRQMTQEYGYSLVLQLVLGQNPGLLAQLASQMFGKAGMMSYSRSMETQADYLGVETMYKAGYNPEGMIAFFSKLDSKSASNPSQMARFFSTHPLTAERIQEVQADIGQLPPKSWPPADQTEFKRIKAKVSKLVAPPAKPAAGTK
ncbi:MAG TPA: M48 family metallopeptidase [Geomobilimonas sp.]|nr:M48 family metallopeptidase [Geomobilimonas sp.]